ncbi:hypothetical protein POM88_002901 [Heracleum sosnowskyi]|uniref:RNase III domain-containing protein n=1 Tax=Heracleum sosnowskyi TaxID=360622 RepID=A0AAD8JGJ8_9APIA|nr:hypothetical protein POM88_002901 [Heracleum sosnowskyi]
MHSPEVELKHVLSVSLRRELIKYLLHVLEALTTEKCNEHFSLERLEVLGDAFLEFASLFLVHDALDEGQLTGIYRDQHLTLPQSSHWAGLVQCRGSSLVGAFILDSGFKGATAFLNWMDIQVEFEDSKVSHICSASSINLPLASQIEIAALEDSIGYQFNNKGLHVQAFVHPSYSYHSGGCYQRREFLGDAVLDYLVTSYLFSV